MTKDKITEPVNGQYVVGCVVCGEKTPVMLYPQRRKGLIVGWVFVCAEHQVQIVGADIAILPPLKPITLGVGADA
jgi:hypothetical protein